MCSIGGIYLNKKTDHDITALLCKFNSTQSHRGPDFDGFWVSENNDIGLSHNRLAIVDLSSNSNQPMHSYDGRFTIVFNGEIYNYLELRDELVAKGAPFKTLSDTEVIIEAYRFWGENCLGKLRGMFAFALYDHVREVLLCARDKMGKKPFIYAGSNDYFAFASELPAILNLNDIDTSINTDALAAMLLRNMRHIPDPHTIYKGVRRLRAGHAMYVSKGKVTRTWRYWHPSPSDDEITPERLRALLEKSVELRMRSDVPVAALLSGGVDSSAIVALMKKHTDVPIKTYALGFDENDEDLRRARIMAERLGTQHKEFYFDPNEQWDIFNSLIQKYGEPIMLLPLVHSYSLCRSIYKDGIKVVMSGNGADELFYGYTGHVRTLRISKWMHRYRSITPFLKFLTHTELAGFSARPGTRKAALYKAISSNVWAKYLTRDIIQNVVNVAAAEMEYWGDLCPSEKYIDESNFVGLMVENTHSVTTSGDLPAMLNSVEIRSPFLDQDIVSFALATPAEKKIPNMKSINWLKAILRDSVSDLVPNELLVASKRGFGTGIQEKNVMLGPWKDHLEDIFSRFDSFDGFYDIECCKNAWAAFEAGKTQNASEISKLVASQVWIRQQQISSNNRTGSNIYEN